MAKLAGIWVQSIKCWNCNKTGKIPNPENPDEIIKCPLCDHGYIRSKGTLSK